MAFEKLAFLPESGNVDSYVICLGQAPFRPLHTVKPRYNAPRYNADRL